MDVIYLNINLTKTNTHQNNSFKHQTLLSFRTADITDVKLNAIVTALEESGGRNTQNDKRINK